MLILRHGTSAELVVRKSRFLSEATPVASPEEAREIWHGRKSAYTNGGHIVFAFVCGPQGGLMGCSDDGEPSGTAGRPALEVLKGSGITNVLLTVARWYGGIKLGTGGLVRAYTEAAQLALENAPVRDLQLMSHVDFFLPYNILDNAQKKLQELEFECYSEEYAENVLLSGRLPEANYLLLENFLRDSSKGSVQLNLLETRLE